MPPKTWEEVLAELQTTLVPELKKEIGETDLTGNVVQKILSIADTTFDVLDVIDKYEDEFSELDEDGKRNLIIHLLDDLIKVPALLEGLDDNIIGVVYDWVVAKKEAA